MRHYYKFAKTEDGVNLEYAPIPLFIDGVNVWTNEEAKYNSLGYYEIVRTESPTKEGYYYSSFYELEENKLVEKWEEHEIPVYELTEEEYEEANL